MATIFEIIFSFLVDILIDTSPKGENTVLFVIRFVFRLLFLGIVGGLLLFAGIGMNIPAAGKILLISLGTLILCVLMRVEYKSVRNFRHSGGKKAGNDKDDRNDDC